MSRIFSRIFSDKTEDACKRDVDRMDDAMHHAEWMNRIAGRFREKKSYPCTMAKKSPIQEKRVPDGRMTGRADPVVHK